MNSIIRPFLELLEKLYDLDAKAEAKAAEFNRELGVAIKRLKKIPSRNRAVKRRAQRRVREASDAEHAAWGVKMKILAQFHEVQDLLVDLEDLEILEPLPPQLEDLDDLLACQAEDIVRRGLRVDTDALKQLKIALGTWAILFLEVTRRKEKKEQRVGSVDEILLTANLALEKASSALPRAWAHWDRAMAKAEAEASADEIRTQAFAASALTKLASRGGKGKGKGKSKGYYA